MTSSGFSVSTYFITILGIVLLIAGCGSQAAVNETWTVVRLLNTGEEIQSTSKVLEVRHCASKEVKEVNCSAGTSKNFSINLAGVGQLSGGLSAGAKVDGSIGIEAGVGTELGFDRNSGQTLSLDSPERGFIRRYELTEKYIIFSGKAIAQSSNGTEKEGDYIFQSSCDFTIVSEQDLPCDSQLTDTPTPTDAPIPSTSTPTSTNTPVSPTSTPIPPTPYPTLPPEVIDSGNEGISITVHDIIPPDGDKNVYLQATAGGYPLEEQKFRVFEAVQDIAGHWTTKDFSTYVETDINGVAQFALDPGMYALQEPFELKLYGAWGIETDDSPYYPDMIVFPVFDGRKTEVVLSLAILEVGVLDDKGSALEEVEAMPYIQTTDIAGKKIKSDRNNQAGSGYFTDERGLTALPIGGGTYIVRISQRFTPFCEGEYFDVRVKPGEIHREIFTCQCYSYTSSCLN